MHVRSRAMHPVIAKAARMLLVFLLVFWSSFSVETLVAFGADNESSSGSASSPVVNPDPNQDSDPELDPTPPQNGDSGDNTGGNTGNTGNSDDSDEPVEQEPDNPGGTGGSGGPDDPSGEVGPQESDRYNIDKHEDGTLTNLEIWELASADAGTVD